MSAMEPGFYNMDCMDGMKEFPDGFFDLAIVDPPYGINVASHINGKLIGGGHDHSEALKPCMVEAEKRKRIQTLSHLRG